jgi:CBS domain-containing protein
MKSDRLDTWDRLTELMPSRLVRPAAAVGAMVLAIVLVVVGLIHSGFLIVCALLALCCLLGAVVILAGDTPIEGSRHGGGRGGSRPARDTGTRARPEMRTHARPELKPSRRVRDVMTPNPATLPAGATLATAARAMRDWDVGDILVLREGRPIGILTDRDIVVRALASREDARTTRLEDVCSRRLVTVSPQQSTDEALRVMGERALRRLPVTRPDGGVVGIVSIADLLTDPSSVPTLVNIHRAQPNR